MITYCPHCGHELGTPLCKDGLTFCNHCRQTIEYTLNNRLCGAAWLLRRQPVADFEQFQFYSKLDHHECVLVYALISDHCYSHDEFIAALTKLGIV